MCGIAGFLAADRTELGHEGLVGRMVGALHHRGPDECGLYLDDQVVLGHARLSIIDLSGGTQPLSNEDESVWIIYNGEVFNYVELREELVGKGHRFKTASDTEVLVHLYEEEGEGFVERLNGQFAFALWDAPNKKLVLARDRMGIRPLFYRQRPEGLLFASEIKAIHATGEQALELDPQVLAQCFTLWSPLAGRTAFRDVVSLPPGHLRVATREGVRVRPYWEPAFHGAGHLEEDGALERSIAQVRRDFVDAVRIRLRADVPVGSYVSGGLDSSGVTAVIKQEFNHELHTFGIRFEEQDFDEGRHQQAMVESLALEHAELWASNSLIARAFPDVVHHCEQPILRTSPVPLYLLSRLVRENGYKVVVTGEGADEVFGGYNIFREAKVRAYWAADPDSVRRPLLLRRLYPYIFKDARYGAMLERFFRQGLDQPQHPLFSHWVRWSDTARLKTFFSADLKAEVNDYDPLAELEASLPEAFHQWGVVEKAQYLEMTLFLSNYLLSAQGDRVAMAHSVEIRLPYLDYRLVDFMAGMPAKWKIRGLNEKYLLKQALRPWLPEGIVQRGKHPYRAPIQDSLLGGDAGTRTRELLLGSSLQRAGLFDPEKVRRLVRKLDQADVASELDGMALAGIVSTQLLHERYCTRGEAGGLGITPDLVVDKRTEKSS